MAGDEGEPPEVIRGLAIFDVVEIGEDLAVSVYGSEKCVCGSVTFTFPNSADRRDRRELIESWARSGTPITYVASHGNVTLVDELDARAQEWLASQLG